VRRNDFEQSDKAGIQKKKKKDELKKRKNIGD
jgi:hypothetical protein